MFGKFMPTEGRFFEIFDAHGECIVEASRELERLIADLPNAEVYKQNVHRAEKAADQLTRETMDLLHKTFITPFDRDVIHKLITTMDDILDLIEDVATVVILYDVRAVTSEANELAHICASTAERVQFAVSQLANMRLSGQIIAACKDIDILESEADRVSGPQCRSCSASKTTSKR